MRRAPKIVRTYTFGCKVNQVDTSVMETKLRRSGDFDVGTESDSPDVVVINTCTVTAAADRQARQLIRRIHRENPQAEIIVTGCYSESRPEIFRAMEGVTRILPMEEQKELPRILGSESFVEESEAAVDSSKTRAVLKMQDGCNAYCSFCILPYIRGRSRSIPLKKICLAAGELERSGHREIVVTGTHIGAYGRDLTPKVRFSEALAAVAAAAPNTAIRVSSLEPMALTPDVIDVVAATPQIRPHFHIPLQSGSDEILRRMNRKHTAQTYAERVETLYGARPDMAIGADVIVGFPGETDADFRATSDLITRLPISYLHVFPFSSRPGTKAESYVDDVPPALKKSRVHALRGLGLEKRKGFYARWIGKVLPVLVEQKRDEEGNWTGYTPHYVPVRFPWAASMAAKEVSVRLDSMIGGTPETLRMMGEIVS